MIRIRPGRITFPNGWDFNVHDIREGEVYFQRWPPGVEHQGMFSGLTRTPIYVFAMTVMSEDGEYREEE